MAGRLGTAFVCALAASCTSLAGDDQFHADLAFSALPNVGVAVSAGQVVNESPERTWAFELEAVSQFFDDEFFIDDGNPAAGHFGEIRIGLKRSPAWHSRRRWVTRLGGVWFRANGIPNIVQNPGDYVGLYGSLGFETRLSDTLSVGPEVSLALARQEGAGGAWDLLPQFFWRATWSF